MTRAEIIKALEDANPFTTEPLKGVWGGCISKLKELWPEETKEETDLEKFKRLWAEATKDIPRDGTIIGGLMKIPYRCPICGGNGIVPGSFYSSVTGGGTSGNISEKCRSCEQGIIWR